MWEGIIKLGQTITLNQTGSNPGSNNYFDPTLIDSNTLPAAKFSKNCIINSNISEFRKVINLYINYLLDRLSTDLRTNVALVNCLHVSFL